MTMTNPRILFWGLRKIITVLFVLYSQDYLSFFSFKKLLHWQKTLPRQQQESWSNVKRTWKKILVGKNGEKNLVGNNFCPFCPLTHVTYFELFTYEKFQPLQEIRPALIRMYCRQHLSLTENTPLAKGQVQQFETLKLRSVKPWSH